MRFALTFCDWKHRRACHRVGDLEVAACLGILSLGTRPDLFSLANPKCSISVLCLSARANSRETRRGLLPIKIQEIIGVHSYVGYHEFIVRLQGTFLVISAVNRSTCQASLSREMQQMVAPYVQIYPLHNSPACVPNANISIIYMCVYTSPYPLCALLARHCSPR